MQIKRVTVHLDETKQFSGAVETPKRRDLAAVVLVELWKITPKSGVSCRNTSVAEFVVLSWNDWCSDVITVLSMHAAVLMGTRRGSNV